MEIDMGSASFLAGGLLRAVELIIARDPYVFSVTALSLKISGTAVLLSTLLSLPLALYISFSRFKGRQLLITLINTCMGLPPVVVGLFVFLMLVPAGPLGVLDLVFTPQAMVAAQLILVAPIITGVAIAAIGAVDQLVKDTAYTLGGTRMHVALVTLREARLGIATAILAGFGRAIAEVGAILIVGGNIARWDPRLGTYISYTRTLTTAITLETSKGDISTSIALGLIVLSLAFAVNLAANQIRGRG